VRNAHAQSDAVHCYVRKVIKRSGLTPKFNHFDDMPITLFVAPFRS